jgi:hypothetical protein
MLIVVQVHDMFFSSSFLTKYENIKIFIKKMVMIWNYYHFKDKKLNFKS